MINDLSDQPEPEDGKLWIYDINGTQILAFTLAGIGDKLFLGKQFWTEGASPASYLFHASGGGRWTDSYVGALDAVHRFLPTSTVRLLVSVGCRLGLLHDVSSWIARI